MSSRARAIDPRLLARFTAACRVAIGSGFVLDPRRAMRPWIGRESGRPASVLLARALGARDLVLAAGTLGTIGDPPALRRWLAAALVADATDFAVTLVARGELPPAGRAMVLGIAGGGVALGALAVGGLERE